MYVNKRAALYPFVSWILFSLHLLYEDMKLNHLKEKFLPTLAKVLHHLASDLKLSDYVHHYWMDFPNKCPFNQSNSYGESPIEIINFPSSFHKAPPNIFQHFCNMLLKKKVDPYPFIFKVNNRTKDLIQVSKLYACNILYLCEIKKN